jgi:hypothetical protein
MDPLLAYLIKSWKRIPEYTDVAATWWEPAQALPSVCPFGCELDDSGWSSMAADPVPADAYHRTLFCQRHGFARIVAISGPRAAELHWQP